MDNSPIDFWNWVFAGIGSGVTAIWSWFRARKRDAAELKAAEIETVEKAIKIWRDLAQDMSRRVDELTEQVSQLRAKVDQLTSENDQLKTKVLILEDENTRLEGEIQQIKSNG